MGGVTPDKGVLGGGGLDGGGVGGGGGAVTAFTTTVGFPTFVIVTFRAWEKFAAVYDSIVVIASVATVWL